MAAAPKAAHTAHKAISGSSAWCTICTPARNRTSQASPSASPDTQATHDGPQRNRASASR